MSEKCRDIAQRCREVREEVFRHLKSIESIGSSMVGQLITAVLTFISTAVVVVVSFLTYSAYREFIPKEFLTDLRVVIATIVIFVVLLASVLWSTWRFLLPAIEKGLAKTKLYKALERATEFVKKLMELHQKAYSKYVTELKNCCEKLHTSGCEESFKEVCLDLDELRGGLESECDR